MAVSEAYQQANTLLQAQLSFLPDFLAQHAFWTVTIVSVVFILIFLFIALFFDFIADAWKIPLGIGADLLKYLGLFSPWMAVIGAILGALSFIFVSDAKFMKWIFAIVSIVAGVAVLPNFLGGSPWGILIAMIPVNTAMMFISTIID